MKKRQVMAIVLAAALALPNTGVVANIAGVPMTVEAAVEATYATVNVDVAVNATNATIQSGLDTIFSNPYVTIGKMNIGNMVKVAKTTNGTWELLNDSTSVSRGDNEVQLRFVYDADKSTDQNGWNKNDKGQYYHDFTAKMNVVEGVTLKDVLNNKWPELSAKTYDASKKADAALWAEEVKAASDANAYGTFEAVTTPNPVTAGTVSIALKYKLDKGYVFLGTDNTVDGVTAAEDSAECTKTYAAVTVNKKAIAENEIKWPAIELKDGVTAKKYGDVVLDTIKLSFTDSEDGAIQFDLVDAEGKAIAADATFAALENSYKIKATIKDSTNYEFAANAKTEQAVTVTVDAPKMEKVTLTNNDTAIKGSNVTVAPGTEYTLKATAEWNLTDAKTTSLYEYKYQWYKDGAKIDGATAQTYVINSAAANLAGAYSCEVSAELVGTASKDEMKVWSDQPAVTSKAINVTISDLQASAAEVAYNNGSSYTPAEYGKLLTNVEYTGIVEEVTTGATVDVVVKDSEDKTVDSSKISIAKVSNTATAAKKGVYTYKVTVDKTADAGTYNVYLKVTDQSSTVELDPSIECVINKQDVAITATDIRSSKVTYGDAFDTVQLRYGAADAKNDTDAQKAIAGKIDISFNSKTGTVNPFTGSYYKFTESGNNILVNVALKADYEKNYVLSGVTNGKADCAVTVDKKKLPLTVKNVAIVQKNDLPKLEVEGLDGLVEGDKVTVNVASYSLYEESDLNRTELKNNVKNLNPGKYVSAPVFNVTSTPDETKNNYDIETKNAELTIYTGKYVVDFVSNGGSAVADKEVYYNDAAGAAAGTLETPTWEGYKFIGWFEDKALTVAYDPEKLRNENVTVYAKWEKVATVTPDKPADTVVSRGTIYKNTKGTFKVTDAAKKTVAYLAPNKSVKTVTVPASVRINGIAYKVTKVANNAFANCKSLTKVTIPSSVTLIGKKAFANCSKLTSVTIPSKVTKIDKSAFANCKSLKTVTIKSKKVKTIGKSAFKNIAKKSVIKTPASKKAAYKKLLKKSGYTKTVK